MTNKDMGINMLHSFWPSEAMRAFRHVIALDKACAIAYWGLYQGCFSLPSRRFQYINFTFY
jgi:hypothetical protein